ncbi:MAG: hypothetical protein RL156_1223 [Bacteroidota bacterium]
MTFFKVVIVTVFAAIVLSAHLHAYHNVNDASVAIIPAADSAPDHSVILNSTGIDTCKTAGFCTVYGGALLASQIKQASMYWSDPAPAFYTNFHDDWQYAHGADKFGHAMAGYVLNEVMREGLTWGGVDTTTAVWSAAAFSLVHQSIIEVRDGYSIGKYGVFAPYLGFSWGDMAANTFGALMPVMQHYVPWTRLFRPKFSVNPSAKIKAGGYYESVFNDYESEYHWLSINVYGLLGRDARAYWTPYINIAVGHSVKDIVDRPSHYTYNGYHELWVSLDYNIEALPGDAEWLRFLKKAVNYVKLPAPCVRLLPSVVWYGFRL